LEQSPCRYSGSIAGGDLVILAHNSEFQFGGISGLEPGDELILTDSEGERIRYVAAAHEQIEAWEGEKLCSGEYELSLLTCTEDGRERHVVRFERA
ncbi:MAG: sortase, partial [Clostridia bacterium]|nr:sortase [Clostridia bacterium]